MGKPRVWTNEQFAAAVAQSTSWNGVLRKLDRKISGGTLCLIKDLAVKLNLDTQHMQGQGWNRGMKMTHQKWGGKTSLSEILIEKSTYQNTNCLKKRLIAEGFKEYRCEGVDCGITEWRGKPAPLQLEHKNGDRSDNRIENLELLCPNCHAQTDTYCGKNVKPLVCNMAG